MKVNIRGDEWHFSIVSDKYFARMHPENKDDQAVTVAKDRTVHFRYDYFCLPVVEHELCHVYISYLKLSVTSKMDVDDIEEVIVETIESVGFQKLADLSQEIYKGLKKEYGRRKKV